MTRDRWSRRELLQGGAGLALGLGMAGCGVGLQEEPPATQTEQVVKAVPDGDLVYFNWSEYLEPKLIKAFENRYGVKVRESNFDSMQGMMAKLRSGNRYDVIFPTAEWVDRLRKANQLLRIDVGQIPNAASVYDALRRTLVRPRGRLHAPVRDVRQRDHLPRRPDQRHVGLVERHGQPVGRWPRVPARRLPGGHRRRQPRQRRRAELDRSGRRGGRQGVGARAEAEDARLLDGRHPEHGVRQRVDPPRLERRRGEHPQPGRQHPGTALTFINFILDPENASKNIEYMGYPMPYTGPDETFAGLVKDDPSINVTVEDLTSGQQFGDLGVEGRRLWDQTWTEIKAG